MKTESNGEKMYCSNCQCDECRASRMSNLTGEFVIKEAARLIVNAGQDGRTLSELVKFSRHFRALEPTRRQAIVDAMEMAGTVTRVTFRAVNRGKPRHAYLAAEVSQ